MRGGKPRLLFLRLTCPFLSMNEAFLRNDSLRSNGDELKIARKYEGVSGLLTQRSKAPKHSRQQLGMPPKMSVSRFGCYSSFLF